MKTDDADDSCMHCGVKLKWHSPSWFVLDPDGQWVESDRPKGTRPVENDSNDLKYGMYRRWLMIDGAHKALTTCKTCWGKGLRFDKKA